MVNLIKFVFSSLFFSKDIYSAAMAVKLLFITKSLYSVFIGKVFTHNIIGVQSKFSTSSCLLNGYREATSTTEFDESMLEFVVCPLSKTKLR